MSSKRTPLYDRHVTLGAKIVDFAGYEMPVVYSGIQEEHLAVRNAVGVFDVSHMGEFIRVCRMLKVELLMTCWYIGCPRIIARKENRHFSSW